MTVHLEEVLFLWLFTVAVSIAVAGAAGSAARVLVVGGTGRVGGSCARALAERGCASVVVGGRDIRNWREQHENVAFQQLDLFDVTSTRALLQKGNFDIVVNTAGPFQGLETPVLMETCLRMGLPYVDVCDDIRLARIARTPTYQQLAQEAKASAIISAGIWPGVSSLLAEELLAKTSDAESVKFNFFTAGSGGAGETILTATFLLLGEDVLVYDEGRTTFKKTATDPIIIDFGPRIGEREIVRLNLIECESCFSSSKAKFPRLSVETRFGTAPRFWNSLFAVMAKAIPQSVLQNRQSMKALAKLSLPMVRLVDSFVGSSNGIHVQVTRSGGKGTATALLTHTDLEKEVGESLADFTLQLLTHYKSFPAAGVFFPEEIPSAELKRSVLEGSKKRALTYREC